MGLSEEKRRWLVSAGRRAEDHARRLQLASDRLATRLATRVSFGATRGILRAMIGWAAARTTAELNQGQLVKIRHQKPKSKSTNSKKRPARRH